MTNITKHNTEFKGESYNGKNCWIDLTVASSTVRIDNVLKSNINLKGI